MTGNRVTEEGLNKAFSAYLEAPTHRDMGRSKVRVAIETYLALADAQPSGDEVERVAKWWADWLVDAVATTTQNRIFLRGEPEEDSVATEAIYLNGLAAVKNTIAALSPRPQAGMISADRACEVIGTIARDSFPASVFQRCEEAIATIRMEAGERQDAEEVSASNPDDGYMALVEVRLREAETALNASRRDYAEAVEALKIARKALADADGFVPMDLGTFCFTDELKGIDAILARAIVAAADAKGGEG
jgi:hypothetical protein